MKNILTLSLLLFLLVPQSILSQTNRAVLTLKDGTKLSGYGNFKGVNRFKFKTNIDAKSISYKFNDLEKVEINSNYGGVETYLFLKIKESTNIKALRELVKGTVSLYTIHISYDWNNGGTKDKYYLRRGEGDIILFISSDPFWKSFKKTASKYFKDCSSLVQKIKKKEFKKSDIVEVVEYYNSKCQ